LFGKKKFSYSFELKTAVVPLIVEVTIDAKELEEGVVRELLNNEKAVRAALINPYHPMEIIGENVAKLIMDGAKDSVRMTVKFK